MNTNNNPLSKFYRTASLSVKLPSRGKYYTDGIVQFDDYEELSILPMTAQDEVLLQNPDALLSGEAVVSVIKSCVPSVIHPKKLLSCDIDTLLVAIRVASYGDTATMSTKCVKCSESNTFTMNLDTLLNHNATLEDNYDVVLENSLTVFLTPGRYETIVKQQRAAFQNIKLEQAVKNPDLSDEQRLSILSQVFAQISKFNYEMVLESIAKVVFTDDEGAVIEITNRSNIGDWVNNINKNTVDKIEAKIKEINGIGIQKTMTATCSKCEHVWEAPIEFNPVNFS